MSAREAFIDRILAEPDDDRPRLVYADWLEEQGEAVPAAFVRAQCERARLDPKDPRAKELEQEEYRLMWEGAGDERSYGKRLLAHLRALGFALGGYNFDLEVHFNRGLIEGFEIYDGDKGASRFVEKAQEVLAHDPVTRLKFVPVWAYGAQYSVTPDLEFSRTTPLTSGTLGRLLQVERVRQLRELDLAGNPLDEEAVRLLTSSPHLTDLRVLRVGPSEHSAGSAYMESFPLPAPIDADCRARLRERFGERVVFLGDHGTTPAAGGG